MEKINHQLFQGYKFNNKYLRSHLYQYLDKNHNNWNKYGDAAKCSLINMVTISLPILYFTENYTTKNDSNKFNPTFYLRNQPDQSGTQTN